VKAITTKKAAYYACIEAQFGNSKVPTLVTGKVNVNIVNYGKEATDAAAHGTSGQIVGGVQQLGWVCGFWNLRVTPPGSG